MSRTEMINSLDQDDFRRELLKDMGLTWNAGAFAGQSSPRYSYNRVEMTHNPRSGS